MGTILYKHSIGYHLCVDEAHQRGMWVWRLLLIVYISTIFSSRQGKLTARIAHDIMNSCSDSDVILTVCSLIDSFDEHRIERHLLLIQLGAIFFLKIQKLTHFAQQIQNYHPIPNCGFFSFDWTLLFAVSMI